MTVTQAFNRMISSQKELSFYDSYVIRYIEADSKTRAESKAHYMKCHAENMASGREELIIFTQKILASIQIGDAILREQERRN